MSEEITDEVRRLAVETKVFQKLDKRREEKSAHYAQKLVAREEQNAENTAILTELDNWHSKLSEQFSDHLEGGESKAGDIVDKSLLLDNLSQDLQKFEAFFSQKSNFLLAYDVRRTQNNILELKSKFQELQDHLQPKKKFGFKGNKKKQTVQTNNETKIETKKAGSFKDNGYHLGDRESCPNLEIRRKDISDGDVCLSNLKNCTVKVFCSPSTVHITDLENTVVLLGPVKTSVFIENCKNCHFVVACQQLRTHETKDSDFYLHVTSKGIIEDCKNVRFAPYNLTYDELTSDFEASGLNLDVNNWDLIDDFNWLASDQHSPNWLILPENERKKNWSL